MNCQEFLSLLPQYPDAMPDAETTDAFLAHAASCPECAEQLADQMAMLDSLGTLDDALELPDAFADGWRAAVQAEAPASRPPSLHLPRWTLAAAAAIAIFGGTALMRSGILFSSRTVNQDTATSAVAPLALEMDALPASEEAVTRMAKSAANDQLMEAPDMAAEAEMEVASDSVAGEAGQTPVTLRTVAISLSSAAYDADLAQILGLVTAHDGWVEYQAEEEGRFASLTLRIPDERLDAFLAGLESIGQPLSSESSVEHVAADYGMAVQSLAEYREQLARLTALYDEADSTADRIAVEGRIGEVQHQIDALGGQISAWDQRAENAMVTISLTEVLPLAAEPTQAPLSHRLTQKLHESFSGARTFFEDVLVFLVLAAPYILGVIVVVVAGSWIYSAIRNRKEKKKKENNP